jgi:hypothetical protein
VGDVLELRFDVSRPQHPRVDVVVNGADTLDDHDHPQGHDPEDLLDTGALLPREVPHRVTLYGCRCGDFGCSALTALVVGECGGVRWTDIREAGGFDSALPHGDLPDPLALGRRTPLPAAGELGFDADDYLRTVRTATEDRWWETRARAVARLTRARLGWRFGVHGTVSTHDGEDEAVAVITRLHGVRGTHLVPIPPGTPEQAADALAISLAGADVRTLPGARRLDR